MGLFTLVFFIACAYLYGLSALAFFSPIQNALERHIIRFASGLPIWIVLGLLLNLLQIPLDWRIFLSIAIIVPIVLLFLKKLPLPKAPQFKITTTDLYILGMIVLFALTFSMYHKGAFSYPYLENDDSWGHAIGSKFVSMEKTLFAPTERPLRYVDPYPPAYDFMIGILHQTNDSINWTIKFFNALTISLCIPFFFFFVSQLTKSHKKALFASFALFAMPAFLSHFIWAIAITMPLFILTFYLYEKAHEDKRWAWLAAVSVASALVASPSHGGYFALFSIIYLAYLSLSSKKIILPQHLAALGGAALAFALWWLPMIVRHGLEGIGKRIGYGNAPTIFNLPGTADTVYTASSFFIAQSVNMINSPAGIGFIISLFAAAAFFIAIFQNQGHIRKHALLLIPLFALILTASLLFIGFFYEKYPHKAEFEYLKMQVETPSLFTMISDQPFLIFGLILSLFLIVLYAIMMWNNVEIQNPYLILIFAWFALSFYAVNAGPFYLKLSPFRAWMVLAIPVAILFAETVSIILSFAQSIMRSVSSAAILLGAAKVLVFLLIAYGVWTTSYVHKYAVNTAQWNPGGFWTSGQEVGGYIWMKDNLPPNTEVFTYTNIAPVIGMDMFSCYWCDDVRTFQERGFNASMDETKSFLRSKGYEYVAIDGQAARRFGSDGAQLRMQEFQNASFPLVVSAENFALFKVV